MQERGFDVDHSTAYRRVVRYSPQLVKKFRSIKRKPAGRWRLNETYIKVKGSWKYYYRAVDIYGETVDFLLTAKRDTKAARSFTQVLEVNGIRISMDGKCRWGNNVFPVIGKPIA